MNIAYLQGWHGACIDVALHNTQNMVQLLHHYELSIPYTRHGTCMGTSNGMILAMARFLLEREINHLHVGMVLA